MSAWILVLQSTELHRVLYHIHDTRFDLEMVRQNSRPDNTRCESISSWTTTIIQRNVVVRHDNVTVGVRPVVVGQIVPRLLNWDLNNRSSNKNIRNKMQFMKSNPLASPQAPSLLVRKITRRPSVCGHQP